MPTLLSRSCPICRSHDGSRLFREANVDLGALDGLAFSARKPPEYMHWRLMECLHCDALYADPAPSAEELATLYRDAEFNSGEEGRYASRTYGVILQHVARTLPDKVGAVDVGTGDGSFLIELLAAGFTNVVGIEPSAAPIEGADASVRPLIRRDIFRPDSFLPGSLSLVTCFQTIEHLADPLSFCRAACGALKPRGALCLIGHNRRALSAKLLGRRSPIFDVEHLQLFSPSSFRHLLQASGFTRIKIGTLNNRYPIRYWAEMFPFPRGLKARLRPYLRGTRFGRLAVSLPAGNMVAVAYRGDGAT